LDNPRKVSRQPAAAKVLAIVLDKLRAAHARVRRDRLELCGTMADQGGA
jgi:hypothetical protein